METYTPILHTASAYSGQQSGSYADDPVRESKCIVRAAISADIPHLTAIYSQFVAASTATFEIVPPDEAEMARRHQAVLDRNLPYLIAELEGYIVGFCYASPFRPREGYRFTVEDSIYVRPDCIGHGVGRLLCPNLLPSARLEDATP